MALALKESYLLGLDYWRSLFGRVVSSHGTNSHGGFVVI